MLINVIFLAKIAINNHFRIVSNKIQSYHNFFLTFSLKAPSQQILSHKKFYTIFKSFMHKNIPASFVITNGLLNFFCINVLKSEYLSSRY